MKQTAVQFLYDQIWKTPITEWGKLLHQAQQMEKEQMENVWHDSRVEDFGDDYIGKQISFNDYYNETFKTKNQ